MDVEAPSMYEVWPTFSPGERYQCVDVVIFYVSALALLRERKWATLHTVEGASHPSETASAIEAAEKLLSSDNQ